MSFIINTYSTRDVSFWDYTRAINPASGIDWIVIRAWDDSGNLVIDWMNYVGLEAGNIVVQKP